MQNTQKQIDLHKFNYFADNRFQSTNKKTNCLAILAPTYRKRHEETGFRHIYVEFWEVDQEKQSIDTKERKKWLCW